ncbi:hypothetical protein [Marinilabilia salmonicolor]|uniref:hypothetical protein n=1 Tax=Marinilabilia salmonicolor TaxID=989 RepID=UPI00029A6CEB|nr:hypothetical protein [Marinilabilia salmonicolor]
MINVKYTQKIPLDYLDNKDIKFNIDQLENELIDLNYDVTKNNEILKFKNKEIINTHWIKRDLPWGTVRFKMDEKNLIIDFNSKIIGAFIIGLIVTIVAIIINTLPLIIIGFFPFGAEYISRRLRIKKLIFKTYSKKERKYSDDNIVRKMPAYFLYIILAIIFYLISFITK